MAVNQSAVSDFGTDSPTIFDEDTARPFDEQDGREDAMEAEMEELAAQLAEDAEAARESDTFARWAEANAAFHDYSARNAALIQMQHPGATRVAGFHTWKNEFDRTVCEGETAIWIWRPNTVTSHKCPQCGNAPSYHEWNEDLNCDRAGTDPDEWDIDPEEEWTKGEILCGFSPAPVYALEQTEGEELPELPTEATGDADLLDPATAAADELGHNVEIVPSDEWNRAANGICDTASEPAEIKVERDTDAETASVLIHEIAHAELHQRAGGIDTQAKEVEAETTAYIVAEHFGLDSSGSAFYLASWADDAEDEIADRLRRIKRAARETIEAIEAQMDD